MNDIFISYAHLDDKPLTEGQKGWITKFHRILEVRLGQLLGEEPTIWRDPKLSGNDVFDQSIVGEFKKARVMLSIMTPRYVKSDWCVRELQAPSFHHEVVKRLVVLSLDGAARELALLQLINGAGGRAGGRSKR